MTPHNQTLLAKLAPMFGGQIENPAVAALGHILWGSQAARRALPDLLAAGGATVGEIAPIRTQATGPEGERPARRLRSGWPRVLIEAKFWAGLTQSAITLTPGSEVEGLRSAAGGGRRYLLLTTWQAMLGRMAAQAAAATPLCLWFSGTDAQGKALRALEPLRQRSPPELFEYADGLVVPRRAAGLRRVRWMRCSPPWSHDSKRLRI